MYEPGASRRQHFDDVERSPSPDAAGFESAVSASRRRGWQGSSCPARFSSLFEGVASAIVFFPGLIARPPGHPAAGAGRSRARS